jgi:putative FmdB family regulatory protein
MPLYEYQCDDCGTFSMLRKMSESNLSVLCESCGNPSPRVISVPNFALLGQATRQAHERNEKSAHEPKAMRRSSCGCAGAHTCQTTLSKFNPTKEGQKHSSMQESNGFQMQTKLTARPWMLGH